MKTPYEAAVLLPWIALFPLLTALINGVMGKRLSRTLSGWIACAGVFAAFAVGLRAFAALLSLPAENRVIRDVLASWITSGDLSIPLALTLDPLSGVLVLVVTGIGFLIHVYSIGYMDHDPDVQRYFAYLNLFTFAMLVLVLADNLVVMFIGWEGVGLCSYLLIGFWFGDPKNATAGRKAFIVNRVGDFGFLIGMFLIFVTFHTLEFSAIANHPALHTAGRTTLFLATLCLFLGATGKSAQIPLYVWLPDAMAGPTPVSALIHAATMVTAGVYMICRLSALFVVAPYTLEIVAAVGVITALGAGLIALTQNDIKKVLAYSTVSQLGFMFLAVGARAFSAGVFHLFTHACFKALLFLGAGSVIHALAGEQDVRRMGGLKDSLRITYLTFAIACLAIAGIPPFAGFFSKDEVLWSVMERFYTGHGLYWLLLWVAGVAAAALTAVYMFRLLGLTFYGTYRGTPEARPAHSAHSHSMDYVLLTLGGLTCVVGFLGVPELLGGHDRFGTFLAPVFALAQEAETVEVSHSVELLHLIIVLGLSGFVAWRTTQVYKVWPVVLPSWVVDDPFFPALRRRAEAGFGIDDWYRRRIVEPLYRNAIALWERFDVQVIDRTVNRTAAAVQEISVFARQLQTGVVTQYAAVMMLGALLLLGCFLFA